MSDTVFQISKYAKGDIIFNEGEIGRCAYLIKRGSLLIFRTVNYEEEEIARMHVGDIVGEMAVITHAPRSASARAAEDTELVIIDDAVLKKGLDNSPPVISSLAMQLIHRLKNTEKRHAEEFISIEAFARLLTTNPREILIRIGSGHIPPSLIHFSRKHAISWAEDIGKEYFRHHFRRDDVSMNTTANPIQD